MLARLLVAPDGDATTTSMLLLGAACLILAAIALAGWRRRKRSRAKWMGRLELLEKRTTVNLERLERLASDEDRMAAVIGDVLERVLPEPEPARPELRVVR